MTHVDCIKSLVTNSKDPSKRWIDSYHRQLIVCSAWTFNTVASCVPYSRRTLWHWHPFTFCPKHGLLTIEKQSISSKTQLNTPDRCCNRYATCTVSHHSHCTNTCLRFGVHNSEKSRRINWCRLSLGCNSHSCSVDTAEAPYIHCDSLAMGLSSCYGHS